MTAPIVGPRTFEQLEDLLGAVDVTLTDEEHERLGAHTAPPDSYPRAHAARAERDQDVGRCGGR